MTLFRRALAAHGRDVKFFRHGATEPYHTSRALLGPTGSRNAVGEPTARGAASPSRLVLWFPAGEVFPKPTDGYLVVDGVALLVERADSPTVINAARVVARERGSSV